MEAQKFLKVGYFFTLSKSSPLRKVESLCLSVDLFTREKILIVKTSKGHCTLNELSEFYFRRPVKAAPLCHFKPKIV